MAISLHLLVAQCLLPHVVTTWTGLFQSKMHLMNLFHAHSAYLHRSHMDFFVFPEWRIRRATYGEQPQKHRVPDAGFASADVTVKTGPPVAE